MAQNANERRPKIMSNNFSQLCVGFAILFLCLSVVIYVKERFEEQQFIKSSCYVRTSSFGSVTCSRRSNYICYFPVWEVEYGVNRTGNATITESSNNRRDSVSIASQRKEQFQIGSTYPCWYKFNQPDKLQWYKPTALFGLILLIFAGILSVLATIYCLINHRSPSQSDL